MLLLKIEQETYTTKQERNDRIKQLKSEGREIIQYGSDEVGFYVKFRIKYC